MPAQPQMARATVSNYVDNKCEQHHTSREYKGLTILAYRYCTTSSLTTNQPETISVILDLLRILGGGQVSYF
jgi:hypothetical protein